MIYVIMLEPVTPGNVGAVARVMKNFAFDKLVLINPQCDHLCDEARNRAKHSQEVLENAEVNDFFIVDDYDYLVATTARVGTDYNISRSPLSPAELAEKLKQVDNGKKIGLVIGREGHGLFNEEIEKCDFVVTIPSTPKYSTLNISHAVAVVLYELHKQLAENHVASHISPIGKAEKDQIMRMFNDIFDSMQWETAEKKETQQKLWKKMLGKAMLTKREAYGVMGFLRKVLHVQGGTARTVVEPVAVKEVVAGGVGRREPAKGPLAVKPAAKARGRRRKKSEKESISKRAPQGKRMTKDSAVTRTGKRTASKGKTSATRGTRSASKARKPVASKKTTKPAKARPARPRPAKPKGIDALVGKAPRPRRPRKGKKKL
jgi:TrmH family RNA methyltransferase